MTILPSHSPPRLERDDSAPQGFNSVSDTDKDLLSKYLDHVLSATIRLTFFAPVRCEHEKVGASARDVVPNHILENVRTIP